jgi:hypothetical protein
MFMYITNQFQTTFAEGGGIKSIVEVTMNSKEKNSFVPITSKILASGYSVHGSMYSTCVLELAHLMDLTLQLYAVTHLRTKEFKGSEELYVTGQFFKVFRDSFFSSSEYFGIISKKR